jgi:hypothetical protein
MGPYNKGFNFVKSKYENKHTCKDCMNNFTTFYCNFNSLDPEICDKFKLRKELKMKNKEQLDKTIEEHWDYIKQVIKHEYASEWAMVDGSSMDLDSYLKRVEFHYKTAMKHGYGHGVEDAIGKEKYEEWIAKDEKENK